MCFLSEEAFSLCACKFCLINSESAMVQASVMHHFLFEQGRVECVSLDSVQKGSFGETTCEVSKPILKGNSQVRALLKLSCAFFFLSLLIFSVSTSRLCFILHTASIKKAPSIKRSHLLLESTGMTHLIDITIICIVLPWVVE